MSNHRITNKQGSNMTLSPLLDVEGNALVLAPKGTKGDAKEIDAETAASEIVERMKAAGWVGVSPIVANPPQQAPAPRAPTPEPLPPPPPAPPPKAEEPPPAPVVVQPEATQVMPPAEVEKLVEETKAPESFETTTPPPAKVKRDRK